MNIPVDLSVVVDITQIGIVLAAIATVITTSGIVFGFLWKFFIKPKVVEEIKNTTKCAVHSADIEKKADKSDVQETNKQIEEMKKTIDELVKSNKMMVKNFERSIEADKHILQGVFACLDGLQQLECNGKVTASLEDMRDFLIQRETLAK